jgi:Fe-S cluster biogenesis protein NfuA
MMRIAWVLLTLLIGSYPALAANTYYVRTNGTAVGCVANTDTVAGSRSTIRGGMACLSGGDTLIVHAGTYAEGIDGTYNQPSGSAGAPTTIRNATGETVWMQRAGGCGSCAGIVGNLLSIGSYITYDGINVDNVNITPGNPTTNPSSDGWKLDSTASTRSDHITITNSEIKNMAIGIYTGGCNTCTFSNLRIHDSVDNTTPNNTGHSGYGSYSCTWNSVWENIESFNNPGFGLLQYNGAAGANNNTCGGSNGGNIFRNNYIHNNSGTGIYINFDGAAQAYNNIITSSSVNGFELRSPTFTAANTLYSNTTAILNINNGNTIQNNVFYANGINIDLYGGSTATCSNNFNLNTGSCITSGNTNPLFQSAGTGSDFHLTSGSAAINAGMNLTPRFTTDKDGVPRPSSAAWDAGAFQHKSSAISLLPPQNLRVVP